MSGSANAPSSDISHILQSIQKIDAKELESNASAKADLLALSRKLTDALEEPMTRAIDFVYKPYATVAARIAIDLNLFEHIASAAGQITSQELAQMTKAEATLITRMLRTLAAAGFVEEPAEATWKANESTRAMTHPGIIGGFHIIYDTNLSSFMKAPKYFRETNYIAPTEPNDAILQYGLQTKLTLFGYLQANPSLQQHFNAFMGNTMGAREYWHDWYDIKGRLIDGFQAKNNSALLVDIGGGKGHDVVAFDRAHGKFLAESKAKLVLQDLPHLIEAIPDSELAPSVSKQGYDFFTEQPVKGARGYFLHHILHDWSDKYCVKILQEIRKAMLPGYSKLLIHELILPDTGATEFQTRYDLVMMTLGGGMERSKGQWTELLTQVGFCNIKFYEHFDHDGIVEAEVA